VSVSEEFPAKETPAPPDSNAAPAERRPAEITAVESATADLMAWLNELEPIEGFREASAAHRSYWDIGYRIAAIRARFAAEALEHSGQSIRAFAPVLGISEVRLRQLVHEHEGRRRGPRAPKRRAADYADWAGEALPQKGPTPGPEDISVFLEADMRARLEELSKKSGDSPSSLIRRAIGNLLTDSGN
jgi:hypothetical protein